MLQYVHMNIRVSWDFFRQYWHDVFVQYLHDLRRLDTASRPTAFAVCALGAIMGMVPLAAMIALFRLVDAVTGARAVRVLTSDLHRGLLLLAAVWCIAIVGWVLMRMLQGLTRKIVERSAVIAFTLSVVIAMCTLAPFRTLLIVCTQASMYPWLPSMRVRIACVLVHGFLTYSLLTMVTDFLLSRSVSVGSYILFLGAIFGSFTLTLLHALRRPSV